ncbi:MAG: cold shock and DUF1294 domain-containing protein [Pseudomonadota bacterium]|nr:cold shock and DUF1294 domain-containing protein [Pseudomonadota bacterium]
MKIKGKLTEWNDGRGFGFIEAIADAKRFFVHISAFPKGRRPNVGDVIFFDATQDNKGRANAVHVQYSTVQKRQATLMHPSIFAPRSVLAALHLILIASVVVIGKLPLWWMVGVLLMSAATFLMYRQDKKAAQAGEWRTPESTLQMMALLGGWSGALWAQLFLRHKSKKMEFLLVFWLAVIINVIATGYVATLGFLTFLQ